MLAISKQLVDLHGGAIRAASAGAGQGSVFTVDLPCVERSVLEAVAREVSPRPQEEPFPGGLILYVPLPMPGISCQICCETYHS